VTPPDPNLPPRAISPSILAVVVLYRRQPAEAETVRGLQHAFAQFPTLSGHFRLLLWDNSPEPPALPLAGLNLPADYRHSARNEGVSGAYNAAAALAESARLPWLLLLDQDTAVTPEFLHAISAHARCLEPDTTVAAIVPFLFAGNFQLSPRRVRFGRYTPVPPSTGLSPYEVFAANSGCLLRASTVRQVGGYSPDFWLDFSDIELFHRLHRSHLGHVFLAGDARLQHDIALMDYDTRMTPTRYRNFLAAEGAFHDLHKSWPERVLYAARLLVRAVRQRRLRNPEFPRLASQALRERLLHSRETRITAWTQANARRRGDA
jgi:GT2 family glycosyltransferase